MRKYFLGLILILAGGITLPDYAKAQQDPEAQAAEILDALSERYAAYGSIKADFKYVIESREEEEDFREEQKGTVWLKDRKFRLDLGQQEIISDDETIWTYIKDAREVQVNHFNQDEFEFHPSEIFNVYKEDYRYMHAGNKVESGVVFDVVELNPLDRDDMVFKVRLYIRRDNGQIEQTSVFEKNGLIYTYEILNMETNLDLDNSFFTFREDENPEVKIIDLR